MYTLNNYLNVKIRIYVIYTIQHRHSTWSSSETVKLSLI